MRSAARRHIVEIAETHYGICRLGVVGQRSVMSAAYGEPEVLTALKQCRGALRRLPPQRGC